MGLFDKKFCDICGEKIGVLGNRKLEDGNCCKDCAKKLSPWFSERRKSTIEDIKAQLADREANMAKVTSFNVTRTIGTGTKVLVDEGAAKFLVTSSKKWQTENPDVIDLSQVTGCNLKVDERRVNRSERTPDGRTIYHEEYEYDFYMIINVNAKWFDEIKFRLNSGSVKVPQPVGRGGGGGVLNIIIGDALSGSFGNNIAFRQYENAAEEIRAALLGNRAPVQATPQGIGQGSPQGNIPVSMPAPKVPQPCPQCGATIMPDANGHCEFCGGTIPG